MIVRPVNPPRRAPVYRYLAAAVAVAAGAVTPFALSDIAAYKQPGVQVWINVPYGDQARWREPTLGFNWIEQVVDIHLPTGTPPAGGWPVICWFHANGNTHTVGTSGELFDTKEAALAAGFAFFAFEFRHPAVNVDLGAPHYDAGQAAQTARAWADAMSLNVDKVFALSRSRGSLAVWQATQPDMAEPASGNWRRRQSSTFQGVWAFNAQTTYNTEQFAELFVIVDERDDFLLMRPNDPRWGSAITDVATAPALPPMAIYHEGAWPGGALVSAEAANDVHYAGMGEALRNAFVAAGKTSLFTGNGGASNPFGGAVAYFTSLL